MPQMSPMNWWILLIFFKSIYLIIIKEIYFIMEFYFIFPNKKIKKYYKWY